MGKYPEGLMQSIRQAIDLEYNDTSMDGIIEQWTRNQILGKLLRYKNILGMQSTIKDWIQVIYGVELKEEDE